MNQIQRLGHGQRVLIFALFLIGGLLLIAAITVFLILISYNSSPRSVGVSLKQGVNVTQFVELPDDDAYPTAVDVAPDGTVYTGSYTTGTIWAINPSGELREIPGTRGIIGSVTGLATGADGTVYILDRETSDPRGSGGKVWRMSPENAPQEFADIDDERGFVAPNDITLDGQGYVYVTDRGRREVWRFQPNGTNGIVWWRPSASERLVLPTGLAFDPTNDAILITDSERNMVFRVPVGDSSPGEILYLYPNPTNLPGFDGITVTPSGDIYIAALDQNGIVQLSDGQIEYIAGTFRGASDVAAAPDGLLYVTNFDSAALILPGVQPQLPFGLDVITFREHP
jgi:sugar lactone lactonase YvrE